MSADNRGIKAENKAIKPEQGEWPGEVLITQCWFCGSLVGEGQYRARWDRMYQGTGSTHSPLCSLSLGLPAHARSAETNSASVTAIPACSPLPAITASPPPPPPFLIHPFSFLSFLFCCSTSIMNNNGGNICRGHSRRFICVETRWCFRISDYQFLLYLSVTVTGGYACDSDEDVRDPAAEMTFILPTHG